VNFVGAVIAYWRNGLRVSNGIPSSQWLKGEVQVAEKQLRHAGLELGQMHARRDASSMVAMETATDNLSRTGGSYLAAA